MRVYLIRGIYLNKLNILIPYCIFTINDTYLYFDKILIKIKQQNKRALFTFRSLQFIHQIHSLTLKRKHSKTKK